MNKSESIKELAAALSRAQGSVEDARKDGLNPHLKSNYVTMASVWEVVRPVLAGNGLAIVQFPCSEAGSVGVETIITHESGEWMASEYYLPAVKNDPQAFGSAITYARRYALMAAIGVAPEDDDAASAMPAAKGRAAAEPKPKAPLAAGYTAADPETGEIRTPVSQRVWAAFWLKTKDLQFTDEQVHAVAGVPSIKEYTRPELDELMAKLKAKRSFDGSPQPIDPWKALPEPSPADLSPNAAAHRETAGAR